MEHDSRLAQGFEKEIVEQDSLDLEGFSELMADITQAEGYVLESEGDRTTPNLPQKELEIESPLTPPSKQHEQIDKHVSFEVDLQKYVQPHLTDDLKKSSLQDLLDEEHLGEMASLALERVEKTIKEEMIQPADITARVKVPQLSKVAVRPPWKFNLLDERRHFDPLSALLKKHLDQRHEVRLAHKQERELTWAPFPVVSEDFGLEDFPQTTEELQDVFRQPDPGLRSEELLWKPAGLRLLDAVDKDDEELAASEELLYEHQDGLLLGGQHIVKES